MGLTKLRSLRMTGYLGAIVALALPFSLSATEASLAETPAKAVAAQNGSLSVAGTYHNFPASRSCSETAVGPLCDYAIDGIATSSDGEVYRHKIVGTSQGKLAVPGDRVQNRSTVVWDFADGSQLTMDSEGETVMGEDGAITASGRQVCLEGSGRFANMDCAMDWANAPEENGLIPGRYQGSMTPRPQS